MKVRFRTDYLKELLKEVGSSETLYKSIMLNIDEKSEYTELHSLCNDILEYFVIKFGSMYDFAHNEGTDKSLIELTDKYARMMKIDLNDIFSTHNKSTEYTRNLFDEINSSNNPENTYMTILHDFREMTYKISKLCKYRDLKKSQAEILENLKYLYSPEDCKRISVQLNFLLANGDIDKALGLYNIINERAREHWSDINSSLDNWKPGMPFRFLGNSISSPKANKRWRNYSSASLFTEEFHNPYLKPYGFIMEPVNMVSAYPYNTFTNNSSYASEDNIISATTAPIVNTPEVIVNKMRERRKNIENGKDQGEYFHSEIVMLGAKPVGIFCFTDGSRDLDPNYVDACKLHDYYPELKFHVFDVSLYAKGQELQELQRTLVTNAKKRYLQNTGKKDYYLPSKIYQRFTYMWDKFMELKSSRKDFTGEDIVKLYIENENMVMASPYDINKLINANAPHEKVKNTIYLSKETGVYELLNGIPTESAIKIWSKLYFLVSKIL